MLSLRKVLEIKLSDLMVINTFVDTESTIVKKSVYNEAMSDILKFIIAYESGEIDMDYIKHLDKRRNK